MSLARLRTLAVPMCAMLCFLCLGTPARAQAIVETHIRVQIGGAVRRPGIYSLTVGSRTAELVAKAGGPRTDADIRELNLTHVLADGEACHVSSKVETASLPVQTASAPHGSKGRRAKSAKPRVAPHHASSKAAKGTKVTVQKGAGGQVHLNRADAASLQTLPGIGPGLADAILEQRHRLGRFKSLDDLMEVAGFGEKRLARLKPFVVVD